VQERALLSERELQSQIDKNRELQEKLDELELGMRIHSHIRAVSDPHALMIVRVRVHVSFHACGFAL
jgi:hypothetical protein